MTYMKLMALELFVASQSTYYFKQTSGIGEDRRELGRGKSKHKWSHVLFDSVLKWSFHGTRYSQSVVQSMAGQHQGKQMRSRLCEQEGRYNAFSAPLSPKFYTDT